MIIFDLVCEYDHSFEGWFKNNNEFNSQQASGLLTCPVCDSENVVKVPSATNINFGKQKEKLVKKASAQNQQMALVQQVSKFIEKNFEDVGGQFSETAKKIHYGEEAERNIRGTATEEQTRELLEEGIDVVPVILKKDIKPN